MVTQPTDKVATNQLPSAEWNWLVDLIDGTGVTLANAGDSLKITRNQSAGSAAIVEIKQDHASDSSNAVNIQQDGTGVGIRIRTKQTTNEYVFLGYTNNSVGTNYFYRNLASADTSGPIVLIKNDHTGDDQPALKVQQDAPSQTILVDYNNDTSKDVIHCNSPTGSNNIGALRWNTDIDRYLLLLGNGTNDYYIWVDDTGDLRIDSSDPATHNAGTVVGTQS